MLSSEFLETRNISSFQITPLDGKNPLPILNEGLEIISNNNFNAMIGAGTLLGFYRDGGFIPHDTDLDIDLLVNEPMGEIFEKRLDGLFEEFRERGFRLIRTQLYKKTKYMQIAFIKNDVIFDIYLYYQFAGNDFMNINECGLLFYPYRHFINTQDWELKEGLMFTIPKDIDDYLTGRYGIWRVKRTSKSAWNTDAGSYLVDL